MQLSVSTGRSSRQNLVHSSSRNRRCDPLGPGANRQRDLKNAASLHLRASRLVERGKYRAATGVFLPALRLAEEARPSDPLLLIAILNDFGVLCKYTGRFADAARMYQRALKLARGLDEAANQKDFIATIYHNLGGIAYARRRYAQGLRYARRGVQLRKKIRPRDPVSLAADEAALATILSELGRNSEAVKLYLRALRVFRSRLGYRHYEVGSVLTNLGAVYWRMARPFAAERALRCGVLILEKALGRQHPRTARALRNLAVVRSDRQGKNETKTRKQAERP